MQRALSDYLQYEMYHVLGAYGVAERKLEDLERRLRKTDPDITEDTREEDEGDQDAILKLAGRARAYNAALGATRHTTNGDVRHPIPADLPLTRHERFDISGDAAELKGLRANPWKGPKESSWVLSFYDTAIHVLEPRHKNSPAGEACTLAENLVSLRDGLASGSVDKARDRRHRRERYEMRRKLANQHLSGVPPDADVPATERLADPIKRVTTDNLSLDSEGSLPFFVINAQAEAHLAMHAVEAWQSTPLGTYAGQVAGKREWLDVELDRCIALGTFAYCVARSAPWVFAKDAEECRYVFENFSDCWQNVVPTRCMWLAGQLGLLALHRRAYARALKRDPIGAYNDYHKLHRQIRDLRRRIQSAPIHVEGAQAFLFGLDAQAHHHIGELYRSEHAHKPAVKHLRSASHGLELLAKDEEMKDVLVNSRWHVQLQVSQGKANYELGHHKEGLCWHLRGWREFLRLLAADTGTTANLEQVTAAIEWLTEVRYEPELLKSEIQEHVGPVVKQLEGIAIADHLGALAADILLRLGHLLSVLNIGRERTPPKQPKRLDPAKKAAKEQIAKTLAFSCLFKAAECDRRNTLAGADMLKTRLRFRMWFNGTLSPAYDELLMPRELDTVARHWPGGSDDYENIARVTEYLMLRAQLHTSPPPERLSAEQLEDAEIARDLLIFFFMHTDSINVRKSQVHRFLMRKRQTSRPRDDAPRPAIEFICMRRYSSAFPLLPRPSTFRALGGGYFVRLHGRATPKKEPPRPFGIVVDPGVDFIENLYRTGYSLSDIDMVIVTHDHVDHLGSLDPLLSLMHERSKYPDEQPPPSGEDPPKLVIYASQSVIDRYETVSQLNTSSEFLSLSEFVANPGKPQAVEDWPKEFEIAAMSSEELDGKGHLDLSEQPALGVCIRAPRGPSVAITSDTPPPPDRKREPDRHRSWHDAWKPALAADVLVCHLSTVPLTELRQLAGIDAARQPLRNDDRLKIQALAGELSKRATAVLEGDRMPLLPFEADLVCIRDSAAAIVAATDLAAVPVKDVDDLAGAIHKAVELIVKKLEQSEAPPDLPHEVYKVVDEANTLLEKTEQVPHDARSVRQARRELEAARPGLKGQVEFGLWLGSHKPEGDNSNRTADLLSRVGGSWLPPPQHAYLKGVVRWAREYERQRRNKDCGLLVVGELSEELGTMRNKVAMQLNAKVFDRGPGRSRTFSALTGDIGLQVLARPRLSDTGAAGNGFDARVLCTICDLDTDRVPEECFHPAHEIREVCVKGENEGIFYNCEEHDPATLQDPVFLEQLERFDIFGR